MREVSTVDDLLAHARSLGVDRLDAQRLMAHTLSRSRSWLLAHGEAEVLSAEAEALWPLLLRRAAGEPLAYVVGEREFHGLVLRVTPDVLVPRPDTETLVDWAIELMAGSDPPRVVDLGTGSGAIALALAHERPHARVIAVDVSEAALDIARANVLALNLGNVEFRQGDWLAPLAGERFDLIASNPPYIALGDAHLDALRYEPEPALSSGQDGLDAIRTVARDAPAHLHPGGWLLLEHGWEQGGAVRALLRANNFDDVQTHQDLEGRDRVSSGRWPG